MFSTVLTPEQLKPVKKVWLDFETVINNTLPVSDTITLMLFHTRSLLDAFDDATVDVGVIHMTTTRINALAQEAPFVLDIDDVLTAINHVLTALMQETS